MIVIDSKTKFRENFKREHENNIEQMSKNFKNVYGEDIDSPAFVTRKETQMMVGRDILDLPAKFRVINEGEGDFLLTEIKFKYEKTEHDPVAQQPTVIVINRYYTVRPKVEFFVFKNRHYYSIEHDDRISYFEKQISAIWEKNQDSLTYSPYCSYHPSNHFHADKTILDISFTCLVNIDNINMRAICYGLLISQMFSIFYDTTQETDWYYRPSGLQWERGRQTLPNMFIRCPNSRDSHVITVYKNENNYAEHRREFESIPQKPYRRMW